MKRSAGSFAPLVPFASLVLALSACTLASDGETSTHEGVQAATRSPGSKGSKDPMDHLNIIADADVMQGRGTGSPGHQKAADYVAGECVKAGLVGAYPGAANAYFQPFTVGSLSAPGLADEEEEAHDFGIDLFEHAIYLNGDASDETRREMGHSVCSSLKSHGQACPAGVEEGAVDPRAIVRVQTAAAGLTTNNVVGYFPGTGPHQDEIILFSAHLDHLGNNGSNVYPGADDNGSGSAVMITMMHSLAEVQATTPLDRTVAFLWTSGEERGLLGAAYFVDNAPPSMPLARIKQLVNMDMVGYWDDTRFSVGADSTQSSANTVTLLTEANQGLPVPFTTMNRDIQQYNARQDGYAFSRRNVPAIFVFEGLSNAAGGGNLMANYHRPTDTLANFMADNGGTKIRKMSLLLSSAAEKLANAP